MTTPGEGVAKYEEWEHQQRQKISEMNLIAFYFSCIILNGCINLSKCDSNVTGKYYCYNHNDAINYIEFHENGDFEHVFEKG